jgi:MinD superfamily P-loop ATPase
LPRSIKIAISSGKGGTGKTTVATNLAVVLGRLGHTAAYVDCDVEEPNGHIFLKPKIDDRVKIGIPMPKIDREKCTGCGKCGEICQYSAIVCIGKKVLTFPELCHGCGGCFLVCPERAITEEARAVGVVERGSSDGTEFVHGKLQVGEAMSTPLIRRVKDREPDAAFVILDSPPGTSCPVIETVKDSDYVVLVTEPTPFGLNDLKLAVEMVRALGVSFGVVINRCDVGDHKLEEYCAQENIGVLLRIEEDRKVAESYSRGEMAVDSVPGYLEKMAELHRNILEDIPK